MPGGLRRSPAAGVAWGTTSARSAPLVVAVCVFTPDVWSGTQRRQGAAAPWLMIGRYVPRS